MIELTPKEIFDRALSANYGIALEFGSHFEANKQRRKLYAEREKLRKRGKPDYDLIKLFVKGRELWIVPKVALQEKQEMLVHQYRELGPDDI